MTTKKTEVREAANFGLLDYQIVAGLWDCLVVDRWTTTFATTTPTGATLTTTAESTAAAALATRTTTATTPAELFHHGFEFVTRQSAVVVLVDVAQAILHAFRDLVSAEFAIVVLVKAIHQKCCGVAAGSAARSAWTAATRATLTGTALAAESTTTFASPTAFGWLWTQFFLIELAVAVFIQLLECGDGIADFFRRQHSVFVLVEDRHQWVGRSAEATLTAEAASSAALATESTATATLTTGAAKSAATTALATLSSGSAKDSSAAGTTFTATAARSTFTASATRAAFSATSASRATPQIG